MKKKVGLIETIKRQFSELLSLKDFATRFKEKPVATAMISLSMVLMFTASLIIYCIVEFFSFINMITFKPIFFCLKSIINFILPSCKNLDWVTFFRCLLVKGHVLIVHDDSKNGRATTSHKISIRCILDKHLIKRFNNYSLTPVNNKYRYVFVWRKGHANSIHNTDDKYSVFATNSIFDRKEYVKIWTNQSGSLDRRDDKPTFIQKSNRVGSSSIGYFKNGKLDRNKLPAFIRKYKRLADKTEYIAEERYYKKGKIHRKDGPAVNDYEQKHFEWALHGVYHNVSGPAIMSPGLVQYMVNGKLHNPSGPAYVATSPYGNVETAYYIDGKLHRTDGPAFSSNFKEEWAIDGDHHREDGPAIIEYSSLVLKGTSRIKIKEHYYLHGIFLNQAEVKAWLKKYKIKQLDEKHRVLFKLRFAGSKG